jgi:transposase
LGIYKDPKLLFIRYRLLYLFGASCKNPQKAALALKKDASYSIREICEIVGISRNTYYKYTRADATAHTQPRRMPGSAEPIPASESVENDIAEERSG